MSPGQEGRGQRTQPPRPAAGWHHLLFDAAGDGTSCQVMTSTSAQEARPFGYTVLNNQKPCRNAGRAL